MDQSSTLRVGVDSREMERGAKKGETSLQRLGKRAGVTEGQFDKLTKRTNVLGVAFAALTAFSLTQFFVDSARAAATFETKMAEVSTLVDTTAFNMDRLTTAIKAQSREFGAAPIDQAAAAYQIISAGASSAADATDILTASNKLAVGGVTSVAVAADGLTTVLNAYGDQVDNATSVSDALFVGMRAGKTTIAELSGSLGKVAPLAANTGVSFDELVASVAALTKGGISTQESVTGIRAVLAAVAKPTQEAADAAKALGIEFNVAALESKGFQGFLDDLRAKTGGSTEVLAQLFGGVEALVPVMALSGAAGEDFNDILEDMQDKSGQTDLAVSKLTDTFEFQAARLRSGVTTAMIDLGGVITRALTPAIKFLADNFDTIVAVTKVLSVAMGVVLTKAIGVSLFGAVATSVREIVRLEMALGATSKTSAVFSGVMKVATQNVKFLTLAIRANPFGAILTAIVLATTALVVFGKRTVEIGGKTTTVWGLVKAVIATVWQLIVRGAQIAADAFSGLVGLVRDSVSAWNDFRTAVGDAMSQAASNVDGFFDGVRKRLDDWLGQWGLSVDGIQQILVTGVNAYIGIFVGFVKAIGPTITQGIPGLFSVAMGIAKNTVLDALQFIVNQFANGLGGIGTALDLIPGIEGVGDAIRENLTVDFSDSRADVAALRAELGATGATIRDTFGDAVQTDYIGQLGDGITSTTTALRDGFNNALDATGSAIADNIVDPIGEAGDALSNQFNRNLVEANTALDNTSTTTRTAEEALALLNSELDNNAGSSAGASSAMKDLTQARKDFIETISDEFASIQEEQGGAVDAVNVWYAAQSTKLLQLGLEYGDYADMLEAVFENRISEAYKRDLDAATDWRSGIERAVNGLGESIGNESDLAEGALTALFDNAANAITNFAKTGKLSFKDFARSVASDILALTTRMLLLNALKAAFGGGFSDGGPVGFKDGGFAKFASGGSVSGPGGPRTDSIPAMLSNGEFVINADATSQFLPLLEAINSGQMEGLSQFNVGGLAGSSNMQPAKQVDDGAGVADTNQNAGSPLNLTVIPQIGNADVANAFDSDEGDTVLINMLERNKTVIQGVLS